MGRHDSNLGVYLEDTKLYLEGKTKKEIAAIRGLSCVTICNRITQTFQRLVNHFEFKEKNIEFPIVKQNRGAKKFDNAKEHSYFWFRVMDDYEKGIKYTYQLPTESKNIFLFEGEAKFMKRSEISVCTDGVMLSTDTLPLAAYRLQEGEKYRIIIQHIPAVMEDKPKQKYKFLKKQEVAHG